MRWRELRVEASDVYFIDDLAVNVAAARDVGINAFSRRRARGSASGPACAGPVRAATMTARGVAMNFGVLIFDQAEELDFAGPWEILRNVEQVRRRPRRIACWSRKTLQPVSCANGMSVNPHVDFATCPPLDYLLVPGGQGTRTEVSNPVVAPVRDRTGTSMQGRAVGMHWLVRAPRCRIARGQTRHYALGFAPRACAPLGNVTVVEERYVHDGNVWSAAGVFLPASI